MQRRQLLRGSARATEQQAGHGDMGEGGPESSDHVWIAHERLDSGRLELGAPA